MPFPQVHNDGYAVGKTLQKDCVGIRLLEMVSKRCQNISVLETSLYSTQAMEILLDSFDSPRAVDQALALIDEQFRSIKCLQEVRVNVFDDPINLALRDRMRDYGWIIKTCGLVIGQH